MIAEQVQIPETQPPIPTFSLGRDLNRGALRPFRVRRRAGFLGCGYQAVSELEPLLLGLHPAFDNIHSRAPGTILSRAYWLTDTITLGEMLL